MSIPTNQKFVDFFSNDQPKTNSSSTSKKQYTIADIKYLVALLYTTNYGKLNTDPNVFENDDPDTIRAVKEIVREKYDCRFPVVFYICNDSFKFRNKENAFADYFLQPYGEDEFLRTYGLGQFLYSAEQHKFLLPEGIGNESVDGGSGNSEEMDDNKIIAAFMGKQLPLNDLQMEHLKMYITPKNIIQRLRHDGGHSRTCGELKEYEEKLRSLLVKVGRIDDLNKEIHSIGTQLEATVSNNDRPSNNEYDRYVLLCNKAEAIVESYAFGKSTPSPIYALLLDDCCEDSDIQEFVKAAESKNMYIATAKTVASAKEELTKQTKLSELKTKAADNNGEEQIDNNPRYTVILVDLLLKEQHSATGSNSNCNLLVSRWQGYDFISELAREGKYYGVILLSTLPRNFKVQVAGTLPMRMRNFPYKDGHKLEKEEYQQILIDMIVEAHEEFNEEAVFRAFSQRGYAMHYIRFMNQNKGSFKEVNNKAEEAIKSFLEYVDSWDKVNKETNSVNKDWEKIPGNKGRKTKEEESQWLSGLTTKVSPVMNEDDVTDEVNSFLNLLYSSSWEAYCNQKCPSTKKEEDDKETNKEERVNIEKIEDYCKKKCFEFYKIKESDTEKLNEAIKESAKKGVIKDFIEECYCSPLSFRTTFELFKRKEEVRDFVQRLLIYREAKKTYLVNKELEKRFVARRLALFLLFWANLSEVASKRLLSDDSSDSQRDSQEAENNQNEDSKVHVTTPFDYVNHILNQNGLDVPKKYNQKDYKNMTSLVNSAVWLKAIYFQGIKDPECPYMTPDERQFFLVLFQKKFFQFELKSCHESDKTLNQVYEELKKEKKTNKERTMCSELIYYFK